MRRTGKVLDLICLVADTNMQHTLRGLLARPHSLRIRPILYEIVKHPEHDPGCRQRSHELLRLFQKKAEHALVLFDREGSGREEIRREELEEDVERLLTEHGWERRCAVVVLDPELEAWLWSDSPEVARVLGWTERSTNLRDWLEVQGFLGSGNVKPRRPKETLEAVLRVTGGPTGTRRSSALYGELASRVGLARCTDPAFAKLCSMLREWFPEP